MRSSRGQVETFFRALLAGATPDVAARAADISLNTAHKWCGVGAPVSIDGVPAGRPLVIAVAEQIGAK